MKEFAIIADFFETRSYQRKDVILGIGDDCALTQVPQGQSLAITTDTLVSGVHFLPDAPPEAIAHKAVTVNLSDLAAMGAEPAWLSLSLAVPHVDTAWLDAFSHKIHELTDYYSIQLIGGDTVRGPLSLTITAQGFVPMGQALTRAQGKPGDWIYVTGTLGDAALALDALQLDKPLPEQYKTSIMDRLYYPTARLLAGTTLRRIANACIDVSDGLLADLQHILDCSNVGATIQVDQLPLSEGMRAAATPEEAIQYALTGGDDYELIFTVPAEQKGNLDTALSSFNLSATCIGQLNGLSKQLDLTHLGQPYNAPKTGYEHFA